VYFKKEVTFKPLITMERMYDIGFVKQTEFLNCNKQVVLKFQLYLSVRDFFPTFSPLGISHI